MSQLKLKFTYISSGLEVDISTPDQNYYDLSDEQHLKTLNSYERLISSAPEMLDALEALINCPDLNLESLEPETIEAIQNAGQAINQAKGGE